MGFCIPLMVVNLLICWIWLTFIGKRLFGPGRKIMSKENEDKSSDTKIGYTNYALEDDSKENETITDISSSGNVSGISLRELKQNKQIENVSMENTHGNYYNYVIIIKLKMVIILS